jgi:hypothetical protein
MPGELERDTLTILKDVQTRLGRIETSLAEIRSEMDAQFSLMTSKHAGIEALERLVAAQGRRLTALERKRNETPGAG